MMGRNPALPVERKWDAIRTAPPPRVELILAGLAAAGIVGAIVYYVTRKKR